LTVTLVRDNIKYLIQTIMTEHNQNQWQIIKVIERAGWNNIISKKMVELWSKIQFLFENKEELKEKLTEFNTKIYILANECFAVISTRKSIILTLQSAALVWTIVNVLVNLFGPSSIYPFLAPMIVAPYNQYRTFRLRKRSATVSETAPRKNKDFVLHIDKESWLFVLANPWIRQKWAFFLTDNNFINNILHDTILKHHHAWDDKFFIKRKWNVYIFRFWEEEANSEIISLYWYDVTDFIDPNIANSIDDKWEELC